MTGAGRREARSLFGEILDWMLAPLLLLWPMSVMLTWLVAQDIANQPFDRALADVARHEVQHLQALGAPLLAAAMADLATPASGCAASWGVAHSPAQRPPWPPARRRPCIAGADRRLCQPRARGAFP